MYFDISMYFQYFRICLNKFDANSYEILYENLSVVSAHTKIPIRIQNRHGHMYIHILHNMYFVHLLVFSNRSVRPLGPLGQRSINMLLPTC